MAFDPVLAERIRAHFAGRPEISERRMFGGVAFLHHGNLCCGVVRQRLMARVGPDQYLDALGLPHASEMDFTGRPLRGMVYVGPEGCGTGAELAAWLDRCESFVAELPPK